MSLNRRNKITGNGAAKDATGILNYSEQEPSAQDPCTLKRLLLPQ